MYIIMLFWMVRNRKTANKIDNEDGEFFAWGCACSERERKQEKWKIKDWEIESKWIGE